MSKIIGIDLGTTNCVGAYFDPFAKREEALIIFDDEGDLILPSNLAVKDGKVLVGREAQKIPQCVMSVKREMGKVGVIPININDPTPITISAEYLIAIKKRAEKRLGEEVSRAVITVPAHFNHLQKSATRKAGERAGLKVEELLPEPEAAALAYSWKLNIDNETILVYDLGGGTFDATILTIQNKICKIAGYGNGLAGEDRLGGYDFDRRLAQRLIEHLFQMKGKQISLSVEQKHAILIMAEKVKIQICQEEGPQKGTFNPTEILGAEFNDIPSLTLNISEFQALIENEISRTIWECRKTFEECKKSKPDLKLNRVIMVGGSSRIPFIKTMLKSEFDIEPDLYDPDLCVGKGAAIYASTLGKIFESYQARIIFHRFPPKIDKTITINGTVKIIGEKGEDIESVSDYQVNLQDEKNQYNTMVHVNEKGSFRFNDVPIPPNENIKFSITLYSPGDEKPIMGGTFSLARGERLKPEEPRISQPFRIKTIDGLIELLPAGAPLGSFANRKFYTADETKEIRIPAYEGLYPIGELPINLPKPVPAGAFVEVSVGYNQKNQIVLSAESPLCGIDKKEKVLDLLLKDIQQTYDQYHNIKEKYAAIMREIYEQLEAISEEDNRRIKPEIDFLTAVMDHELNSKFSDPHRITDYYLRLEFMRTWLSIPRPNIKNVEMMVEVLRNFVTKVKTRRDANKFSDLLSKIEQDIVAFEQNAREACNNKDVKKYTEAQREFRVMLAQLQELQPDIDLSPEFYKRVLQESENYIKDCIRYFKEVLGEQEQLPEMKEHDLWSKTQKQFENKNLQKYFDDLKEAIRQFYSIKNSKETDQAKSNNLQILLVNRIIPLHKGIIHEVDQKGLLKV